MNQYLSIKEEIGVYGSIDDPTNKISNDELKNEDAIFKSMNINYTPDNSIDIVLDALYAKILQKLHN